MAKNQILKYIFKYLNRRFLFNTLIDEYLKQNNKVPANIELKLNKTYRLNFVIVCNDKRPSHNWLLTALITRRSPSVISWADDSVDILEVAKTLSKEGLWFEALEMIYIKGLVDDSNFNSLLEVFRE